MPRPPADHDWDAVADAVETTGHAVLAGLLTAAECAAVADGWADEARFRKHVAMARHAYGEGDYRYYGEPLPDLVAALRRDFYPPLAGVAARLDRRLGRAGDYPADLDSWRARCAAAGQAKPTPLLLRYAAGGYNCLHRDLYGTVHFPLQMAVLLSRPGDDFAGGEFLLVEQRPRMQSVGHVVPLRRGDAVVFPVAERPALGRRGWHRVQVRHGVSRLHAGQRYTLGIIFHDAA